MTRSAEKIGVKGDFKDIHMLFNIRRIPLGYVLFAIRDEGTIVTQSTDRLQRGWKVDWNNAKIVAIDENHISLIHPDLYSKDGKRAILGNPVGVSMKKGKISPVYKMFGIELFCGVLVDDSAGIVCLLGLKEQH